MYTHTIMTLNASVSARALRRTPTSSSSLKRGDIVVVVASLLLLALRNLITVHLAPHLSFAHLRIVLALCYLYIHCVADCFVLGG